MGKSLRARCNSNLFPDKILRRNVFPIRTAGVMYKVNCFETDRKVDAFATKTRTTGGFQALL